MGKLEELYGETKMEEELEEEPCESQCSTNDKATIDEESRETQFSIQESKIDSSSCEPFSFSIDEMEDAFEELACVFENINLKRKKKISKLNVTNEFLMKAKLDLGKENKKLKMDFEAFQKNFDIRKRKCKLKNVVDTYKKKID